MEAESFKDYGHGRWTDVFQMLTDIFPLQSKCHILASADRLRPLQVMFSIKVYPSVRAFVFYERVGYFCKVSISVTMAIERRNEFLVLVVCYFHTFWLMITREAFEPRTENTLVIVGTDFFLTVIGNTLSWECGNVIRLYHKERRLDNLTAMRCALVRTSSVRGWEKSRIWRLLALRKLVMPSVWLHQGYIHRWLYGYNE